MAENDPGTTGERVLERILEHEMRESFIDYSMSVNVQRALPDVRDGLKPVHRRILYAMSELGLSPGRAYKKCATVVGEVLGKYHPHGDSAVYDALVRMVQDFSLRYPLVDGQGNFGSIDGDSAAAYRYTEARLQRLSMELLADIDKDTVRFDENFDGRLKEPSVLPCKAPNLLINGSSGIAVGMATNIPPHNLREIVSGLLALIDDPRLSQDDLELHVKGPDFPTGGYICGTGGVQEAYRTGRGRIVIRARADIELDDDGPARIIVSEIPFMVNKARLIEQIAALVREKRITSIRDLRDESDRDGLRVVIELKRDAVPQIVLNRLYKHTQMQSTFGVILLALVDGVPRVMPLRDMLTHFIDHRHTVVVRRSEFDLAAAREREHVLEGLRIAVDNIDEVVRIIRGSRDAAEAAVGLRGAFDLSERQARAILDMRLARLTGLEKEKLDTELAEVRERIAELVRILSDRSVRMGIIKDELREIAARYGDDRRSEIIGTVSSFDVEDLIADEEVVLTMSRQGYVKRIPIDTYRAQRRGGRGIAGMDTKAEDWVENLFVASTHEYLMAFTDQGRCHWVKVWGIPHGSRYSKGKPIVNFLELAPGEKVASVLPVRKFSGDRFLLFCTKNGVVKKTPLSAYGNVRAMGIYAIKFREGDELIDVRITDGTNEVVLATRRGKAIRFHESDVRPMGRHTEGVMGIRLGRGDEVVGMVVVTRPDETLLSATEYGMGKRSQIRDYRLQQRGGQGVINLKLSKKTDRVVAVRAVTCDDQLMVITRNGVVNRQPVSDMRVIGRAAQGVRLVNLDRGDTVVDVARVVGDDDDQ
ncbi:MAG: DNA gyrase subunit A [Gemmatimonadetes bacterium]|nr:DNA gyrase subunit A [Gemmatimonadota bacterium]MYE15021.1 DNA gyrase subunit A [Gemmatimonadota bacterium]MYG24287.1 DNA gyrase subunit A [Gemmatimonadota bacterium]MYJ38789.1 DNA gyrase subunit A [Gemmatimonadota bacterium]